FRGVARNAAGQAVSNVAVLRVNIPVALGPYRVRVKGLSRFSFRAPPGVARVRITVEDLRGRRVWDRELEVGPGRIVSWSGTDRQGRLVSSGLYVVKVRPSLPNMGTAGETRQAGTQVR